MQRILLLLVCIYQLAFSCALCSGYSSVVKVATNTQIADNKLCVISISFIFDEQSSKAIGTTYDANRDGVFSKEETKAAYNALSQMQAPKFMTVLLINSKEYKNLDIQNFALRHRNKNVVVSFDVILNLELKPKDEIELYFIDSQGALVFLQPQDMATIQNLGDIQISKINTFKVLRQTMTAVNVLRLQVK